jgi:hypothetical protein
MLQEKGKEEAVFRREKKGLRRKAAQQPIYPQPNLNLNQNPTFLPRLYGKHPNGATHPPE